MTMKPDTEQRMSPEKQRIAIAEACGWEWWTSEFETLLLPPGVEWPTLPHWVARGMKKGDSRPEKPFTSISAIQAYTADLNAMHEAEKTLAKEHHFKYIQAIYQIVISGSALIAMVQGEETTGFYILNATAAQRAEAFLRTIGKWKPEAREFSDGELARIGKAVMGEEKEETV